MKKEESLESGNDHAILIKLLILLFLNNENTN